MLKPAPILAIVAIGAMGAGEVVADSMRVGHAMRENDAKLEAARSAGR